MNKVQVPKLSIITINYNNKIGLQKTIESVICQSSLEFEYIVIDGGSWDGSVAVIEQYAHSITYWISEPDNGIYHAMNKGIKQAKGKYCTFLNSGDYLVKDDVVISMLSEPNDTGILIGNLIKLQPSGKLIRDIGAARSFSLMTFYKGTLNHASAYIERSLFHRYGMYDESFKIVSDWKWYLMVIVLNNEQVTYKNIDVAIFDISGISNTSINLLNTERNKVLNDLIPANILKDYKDNWFEIEQIKRFKRFHLYKIIWFFERILFKIEVLLCDN